MNKIEINILTFILIEAFSLLFLNITLLNTILGIILGCILIYLSKKIKKNQISKLLLFIITIPFLILTIYKTICFISHNILKNYSIFLISLSLLITSIYLANKKYHSFIKVTEILFYLIIIIKLISLILCIPLININNFKLDFSINYYLLYIGFFILILYKYLFYLTNYQVKYKILSLSFMNPIYIKTMSIFILGNTLSKISKYPYVDYLKRIKYFDFIERLDGILSFEYLFCFIILISFLFINIIKIKKPI